MDLHPSQFRLLLAGPKVSRLLPFFTSRGYVADACQSGSNALELMRREARHVLLVELELEDMMLGDLLHFVRRENLAGAVILLDDPAKSGMIVSQLIRGVDGYVATPPDELYLFRIIERQLLAQWAIAQTARIAQDQKDKQRLQQAVQAERAKVTQLVKDLAALRDQARERDAAALEIVITEPAARAMPPLDADLGPGTEERTSPMGWQLPPGIASAAGFGGEPHTKPGFHQPAPLPMRETAVDEEEAELFLDLDDTA